MHIKIGCSVDSNDFMSICISIVSKRFKYLDIEIGIYLPCLKFYM